MLTCECAAGSRRVTGENRPHTTKLLFFLQRSDVLTSFVHTLLEPGPHEKKGAGSPILIFILDRF